MPSIAHRDVPFIPRVIGHRGAAARAPENTLAGFRKAAALGCKWVEFDVRLTSDDQAVVFHDDELERVTDGRGAIAATPLERVRALRTGGEPIPTLAEALATLRTLGLGGDLEMKAEAGCEMALARAVAQAIDDRAPPLLVTSFSTTALAAIAAVAPQLPRGVLTEKLEDWYAVATRLGAVALACEHRALDAAGVSAVKAAGLTLLAYTVNDPTRATALLAWGVDAVITDMPDVILAAVPRD